MVLFTKNHTVKRYSGPNEIINEFFEIRRKLYIKRKEHMMSEL